MKNIRIEYVGDINSDYPYLEVFLNESVNPFLDIGITKEKTLYFKLYISKNDILMNFEDWEYILSSAKEFLPEALKNEEDFLKFAD